jgi:hypothetical protein
VENSGISTILNDVFVISNGAGWAVGNGGVILHKATPTAIDSEPNIASEAYLLQNYSNPFNPGTTIAFEISQPTEVRILVYWWVSRLQNLPKIDTLSVCIRLNLLLKICRPECFFTN